MRLGDLSALFESGNVAKSVSTISYNPNDPGGKSYGKFQIATRTGTLKKYIAWSIFNEFFQQINPASSEFDDKWNLVAKQFPVEFEQDQYDFIKLTHYKPIEAAAKTLGFDTTNPAIQEVLFSIGVQHAGYKTILNYAADARNKSTISTEADIKNLYSARTKYVSALNLPSKITSALIARYEKEMTYALTILEYYKENNNVSNLVLSHESVSQNKVHLQ